MVDDASSNDQEPKIASLVRVDTVAQPRWHIWLIITLVAVNLAIALTPRFFPYGDTPNHLARYTLINASWHGTAPGWVHFQWLPTSYIGIDVVGAALVSLTSPIVALRILIAAYVVLLPLGMFALIRAVNPRAVGWTLVACLTTFNWYFLAGFLSYCIGVALSLLWLAWWWPRRESKSVRVRILGAIGIALLFLVHMAAAVTALIPVGIACLEPFLGDANSHQFALRRTWRRLVSAGIYFAPAVGLNLLMKWDSAFPQANEGMAFRFALDKFSHLLAPFFSFSKIDGALVVAACVTALVICWSSRMARRRISLWPLASAAMIICYFVAPVYLFAAWDVDVRFLLPALLIAFIAPASDEPQPPNRVAVWLLFGLGLVHAANTYWSASQIDAQISRVLIAMRSIPKGANTLVLVAGEGDHFRVDPFLHAGEWMTIADNSSRVSGLFSGGPNGSYLGHFVACPQLYDVGVEWAHNGFPALDWAQTQRDYGYIALVGANPTAQQRILVGATPIRITPSANIYRVTPTTINVGRVWPIDSAMTKICNS